LIASDGRNFLIQPQHPSRKNTGRRIGACPSGQRHLANPENTFTVFLFGSRTRLFPFGSSPGTITTHKNFIPSGGNKVVFKIGVTKSIAGSYQNLKASDTNCPVIACSVLQDTKCLADMPHGSISISRADYHIADRRGIRFLSASNKMILSRLIVYQVQ
jgi:hypothetical protein